MAESFIIPKPKDRKLFFSKEVNQSTIEELTKEIITINDDDETLIKLYNVYDLEYKPKPIEIYIDSYGGLVYQTFGLIGVMENSKTPIHTFCTGAAMSCGFVILIHGHKRFCYKHGTPLYHQVSSGVFGTKEDIVERVVEIERIQNKLEEMTIRKTKITKEKLDEVRKTKFDWYMTAEIALSLGVVDKII